MTVGRGELRSQSQSTELGAWEEKSSLRWLEFEIPVHPQEQGNSISLGNSRAEGRKEARNSQASGGRTRNVRGCLFMRDKLSPLPQCPTAPTKESCSMLGLEASKREKR